MSLADGCVASGILMSGLTLFITAMVCLVIGTNSAFKNTKPSTPTWKVNPDTPIIAYSNLYSVTSARRHGMVADIFLIMFFVFVLAVAISKMKTRLRFKAALRLTGIFTIYIILYVAFCHSHTYFLGAFGMADNVTPTWIVNGTYTCNGRTRNYERSGLFLVADLECNVVPNHSIDHSNLTAVIFIPFFCVSAFATFILVMNSCECMLLISNCSDDEDY
jgi:hypothetical protein